jgi:YHS domain-containing protein
MDGKMRLPIIILVVVALVALAGVALFAGCRRPSGYGMHADCDHAAEPAGSPKPAAVVAQTTCPVMGGAINKEIFVEYRGEKVYFCCKGCDKLFQENPEQYLAKLPQFQK